MERSKKRRWPLIILLAALVGLLLLVMLPKNTQEQVSGFVVENRSALEIIARAQLAGDHTVGRYKRAKVEGVYGGIVQFSCSSSGLTPASRYRGFYYSKDGTPAAFQAVAVPLEQTADGEWRWTDGTDNGGVTKRLTEHWFYYEAWF